MNINDKSIELHRKLKGKFEITSKYEIKNKEDLSLVYTPGVAASCMLIHKDKDEAYNLTTKHNTVAVVSDGTAVLGLGDIGPLASMPVMEGKCVLFKQFANVNAVPIVLDTKDTDELVAIISAMAPSFGGINLEDIAAPRCFEIEKRLREKLDIPVFHDDQHGTAIAVGAALLNSLKLLGKKIDKVKIVINGAGSAGVAITKFIMDLGVKHIVVCDIDGILEPNNPRLNSHQKELAKITNQDHLTGTLIDAMKDADVFIGVSAGNVVSEEMIKVMTSDSCVFACANPTPEISIEKALSAGVRIYGAGVSNVPNQINNALVFPGLFKGVLESRAKQITPEMEVVACKALSEVIQEEDLREDYIIPNVFNELVSENIAKAIVEYQKSK